MPPLPIIADTYRVTFNWRGPAGQGPRNVLHFRSAAHNEEQLAQALEDHFTDNMWALVTDSLHMDSISVLKLDGTSPVWVHAVTSAHATGGRGGDYVPGYSAVLSLHTALRGRRNRGRVFLPYLPEGSMVDGRITDTNRPACATAWATFNVDLAALGDPVRLVVASYRGVAAHNVEGISLSDRPGVQRLRQRRSF
jgi:hypothetical protein